MSISFEGDILALTLETEEVCRQVLKEKGFTNSAVQVEAVGQKGDNYVANVKRFIAQQEGVNNGKPFRIIAKLAPSGPIREFAGTAIAFRNEITVYSEIFPKFDQLQEEANIPANERLRHPICYKCFDVAPNEAIFMEDLRDDDFVLLNRFVSMTNDQTKLVLKDLAKFHALSFVLKAKDLKFYEYIKNKLINMWVMMSSSEQFSQLIIGSEQETQNMVKNEEHKRRIKGIIQNFIQSSVNMNTIDINSKHSVFIHGDCWTNNMLFKIKNDTALEVIMLDYQATRVGSPAAEVFYFLLNCVDYESRKKYFNDWIDYYYKCFDDFLSNFGLKANYVYSRDKFDADLQMNSKTAFAASILLSNMMVRESQDVIDYTDIEIDNDFIDGLSVNNMRDVVMERYSNKVNGIIQSCVEYGFI